MPESVLLVLCVAVLALGLHPARADTPASDNFYCYQTPDYHELEGSYTVSLGNSILEYRNNQSSKATSDTVEAILRAEKGVLTLSALETNGEREPLYFPADERMAKALAPGGPVRRLIGVEDKVTIRGMVDGAGFRFSHEDDNASGHLQITNEHDAIAGVQWSSQRGQIGFGFGSSLVDQSPVPMYGTGNFPAAVNGTLEGVGTFTTFLTHKAEPTGFRQIAAVKRNNGTAFEGRVSGQVWVWRKESAASFWLEFRIEAKPDDGPKNIDATLRYVDDDEPAWRWGADNALTSTSSDELSALIGCDVNNLPRLVGRGQGFDEDGRSLEITYRLFVPTAGWMIGQYQWQGGGVKLTRSVQIGEWFSEGN